MGKMLITNNPAVMEKYSGQMEILYLEEAGLMDVLRLARDKIHSGHKLLTHPLSGSVKPDQTPYKSVILSGGAGPLDVKSLELIEGGIRVADKQIGGRRLLALPDGLLEDFQLIDLELISGAIS